MSNRSAMRLIVPATVLALLAAACSSSHNAASTSPSSASASTPVTATSAAAASTSAPAPASAAASATAAASSSTDTEKATINYFTFSAAPDHLSDLNKIVQAFEAANPNITVKVQTAAYADYFTKLSTELAAGTAPDTFELDYQDFVNYASSGSLLSLTGNAYDPAAYTPSSLKAFSYQGSQMALPESFSDVLLFYNKTLFDKAGVAYPTSSWTWTDEMAAAKKLTNKSTGVWGLFQPVTYNEFYKALDQAGGSFLSADGTQATFNSAAGVAAANWLIGKLGTTMPTLTQIGNTPNFDTNLFTNNKLAMWINGNWQFSGLAKMPGWDVVVEPGDTQQASAVFFNGIAASKNTKHPDAALKWLQFMSASQTSVTTRVNSAWELPPITDTSSESSYLTATPPANRQAVFDSLKSPSLGPVIAKQQQMQDIVNNALQNAAAGRSTVQAALDSAATQVTALLK
ncbi:MAG TPA: sugar ABC transporter substrate-binding protein [Acidothermaceae bacterium]|jgi:multiple sugar transport system substrate-binding protein